jgi:DNA-binding response OmpR family regulator
MSIKPANSGKHLLRRQTPPEGCCPLCHQPVLHYTDGIRLIHEHNAVQRGDVIVCLTNLQFDILFVMLKAYPAPVNIDDVVLKVWGVCGDRGTRQTLYVHLFHLREKLLPIKIAVIKSNRRDGLYSLQILPMRGDKGAEKPDGHGRATGIGNTKVAAYR